MNLERMNLHKKLDKALHYTAKNLDKSGHNSKPVLFHSFKVSELLCRYGYKEEIVIAGALHDLIEDTDVTYKILVDDFGKKIADLVLAVSFNPNIDDKYEQAKLMFENAKKHGKDALLIKCSDLIDNIQFVQFVESKEKRMELFKKYDLFIKIAKDLIGKEKIFMLLKDKVQLYRKSQNF